MALAILRSSQTSLFNPLQTLLSTCPRGPGQGTNAHMHVRLSLSPTIPNAPCPPPPFLRPRFLQTPGSCPVVRLTPKRQQENTIHHIEYCGLL